MAKTKSSSKGKKAQYVAYATQNRALINKQRKVKRHLKNNPNASLDIRTLSGHSRKKPKTSTLTKHRKYLVKLLKYFSITKQDRENIMANLSMIKKQHGSLRKNAFMLQYNVIL